MVISNPDAVAAAATTNNTAGDAVDLAHPSGIPRDRIDNIMSGIANTGDVKMNNHRKKLRQRFDIIKKLGQGTYGKVQLGINKETGQEVAIKTIKKCKIEAEADLVRIRREVQIMSSVQHPNIIHIYEVFENREKMVLVMEFAAGGELYDYLSERKVLNEEEARRIFRQVATAVYYCHKHKICHRDLKLENILLDEHGNAKIADFGLSNVFDEQNLLSTFCGSPLYASPEIVEGTPYQGPEVDCWSLGVLLYTLVYGSMPFDGSNFKRLVKQISQGDYYEPKKPSRASTLIRDMLTVSPRKRATIEQICAHWWVNENDNVSCLDLAEELATQTPVRLDVLLSLTPSAVTADQLVVPSADAGKGERVPRSHSVGSIRDMGGNTEAERRILDMVAAGGEAALMPSPTRTITPTQSPVQSKRKLQTTVSTENAHGAALKKKDKPGSSSMILGESTVPLPAEIPMETEEDEAAEQAIVEEPITPAAAQTMPSSSFSQRDMEMVGDLCEQLIKEDSKSAITAPNTATLTEPSAPVTPTHASVPRQKTVSKLESLEEAPEEKDATKVIKKFVNKHKTADLVNAIGQITPEKANEQSTATSAAITTTNAKSAFAKPTAGAATANNATPAPFVRKCSLQDEGSLNKFNADRRKSRVLETTEKLQQMNTAGGEKPKKFSIPGVSVGSFKKEFERKATNPPVQQGPTPGELRAMEEVAAAAAAAQELEADEQSPAPGSAQPTTPVPTGYIESSDSKTSVASLSLEDARRSMENSIALLRQAQSESSKEVDQLCAQTENIEVSEASSPIVAERERKLKNARAIIGNAIQPVIRRPPSQPSFGIGGGGYGQMRAASGGFIGFGSSGSGSGSMNGMVGDSGYGSMGVNAPFGGGSAGGFGFGVVDVGNNNNVVGNHAPQPQVVAYNMSAAPQLPQPLLASRNANAKANSKVNANANVALAAARQHIMGRLAATAGGQNEFQSEFAPSNYFIQSPTTSTPTSLYTQQHHQYHQQQPQVHQHNSQQQKQQQQQQQRQSQPQPSQYQATNSLPQSTQNQLLQFQQRLQQLQQQRQRHHQALIEQQNEFELQQQQQQQQEKHAFPQPLLQQQQYQNKQAHSMSMPHTIAASATAANVKNTAISSTATATTANSVPKPFYNAPPPSIFYKSSPGGEPNNTVKTSTATITLKSATLPRRKPSTKTEIQLEIKPRIVEKPNMHFTTEMQHPVADLRSAPPRDGPAPYSPIKTMLNARATSLEPKEHIIPIQRPQAPYARTTSNTTTRSGSLSRQSTNDSESDTTTTANMSQSTVTGSSQPIKKSPREFIIPIAMEGGGFITPREGSIEPSESSHTASSRSTFSRLRPTRRIGSSLLNDSGIDDNSPFQKFRTSSGTREADEEPRFTLHRLRSSRPVKKLSQENDSQSSGEEDDDDGFEILTAENLFSTLLQRVHALTHRMNVDKDLTAGFSNSSRLLSNMRHGPFWNQEPFGSRLNSASGNNVGAPWRHSMSRDLGNDMDSIFSRTGATLPRGTKAASKIGRPATIAEPSSTVDGQATPAIASDEPLDLADLDLSRLRLSKKDLETLSSITPGLPKCFQEQLLAKLPPTQARKLSRTLSMQGGTQTAPVRVYKRSQSGGRGVLHTGGGQDLKENLAEETASSSTTSKRSTDSSERRHYDPVYRRSLSRTRYDYESSIPSSSDVVSKSRSSSVCRDDYGKSICSTYTTDINDRYKYYSPYLNKTVTKDSSTESGSVLPQKRYSSLGMPRDTVGSAQGRPPSGCLSPPILSTDGGSSSLRRRSSQKRISRFLRPDFFDEPLDENPFQREKKQRERETQSVLREIRERSREPSRERCNYSSFDAEDAMSRKQSLPNAESSGIPTPKHVRNKSMEIYSEYQPASSSSQETIRHNRRSLSRPRDITEELRKNELADKILEELQLLSATRTQQDQQQQQQQLRSTLPREISVERTSETTTKSVVEGPSSRAEIEEKESSSTIKKIKKIKPKDKSNTTESSTDADATVTTSVVKKVKKIVRKTETTKTTLNEAAAANLNTAEDNALTPSEIEQSKRESKLKRPKSYPTKEPTNAIKPDISTLTPKLPNKPSTIPEMTADTTLEASNAQSARESRLIRPKSYPASKLTPPKESRKITRSGAAIPTIAEGRARNSTPPLAVEEKFEPQTPISRGTIETSSSSDAKPTTIKKIVKVSKKSKLAQPLPVTPTTPTPATTSTTTTPAENSKESSPVVKEKSPEKKPSKGLLYAIGQKFEKLRDSAMSKEKKSVTSSPASSANGVVVKKKSPESSSPDKVKDKSTLLKKKKSLDGSYTKSTVENNTAVKPPGIDGEVKEKPAKADKRSRIDAVIRSLRERSVPRSRPATETNYIKRAVSVEDMPGTFNKNAVNRVLGLFKRNDKDANGAERRVQSTRSTSNIERQIRETSPSPIYQNTGECHRSSSISAAIAANLNTVRKPEVTAKCSCEIAPTPRVNTEEKHCAECLQDAAAIQKSKTNRDEKEVVLPAKEMTQGNKDKRKGLMLDLTKLDKIDNNTTTNRNNIKSTYMNGNGIYSNLPPYPGAVNSSSNNSSSQQSMDNATNNNNSYMTNNNSSMQTSQTSGYRTSSTHEINRNHLLTPSTENIANYSSDSRSYQDDCASTSTFLSPTEEPELYFDNWSVCSEDNYMLHASPSPTVSRLSRASQLSSPTRGESSDPNESVIDRIKRRSFYCRFNDKKPKRTSSIVGPSAVRDYYREQQAAVKARSSNKINPNERAKSPDITQEFFRPLKLSPVGTELKPPIYKAPLDYATNITKPRKSLNDIRPTTSPSLISKRYGSTADSDYMTLNSGVPIRYKSSASSSPYESKGSSATSGLSMGVGTGIGTGIGAGGSYYNTYSPKRRSSYTFNGTLPSGATLTNSTLDGYATVGRRPIRAYDHRTMSLLDPTTSSTPSTAASTAASSFRREARTPVRDYTSSISRSNSRYRTSSATRSPTNI